MKKYKKAFLLPIIFGCTVGIALAQGDDDDIVEGYEGPDVLPVSAGEISSLSLSSSQKKAAGSRFAAFAAGQKNGWKANIDEKSGKIRVLYGSASKRYGSNPENTARAFLRDSHELFGFDDAELKTVRVDKTPGKDHVRLQQTYNGIPVNGAFVLVHSNKEGQVTMAQNGYVEELQVVNSRVVSEKEAKAAVLADLQASVDSGTIVGDSSAEEMVTSVAGQYHFVWKITVPTQKPFGLWVYYIDAEDSSIHYKADEIVSLKNGKGRVYKSDKDYLKGKIKTAPLKWMFTEKDGYEEGWLWGLHATIWDNNGNDPYEPSFKFLYNPAVEEEKPWFDTTTAYYKATEIWQWWDKVVKKYGPEEPDYFYQSPYVPTIVNVEDMCNAFYSPDTADFGTPFFAFGNEDSCASGAEDLVLDQGVFMHEYTHAMMDWAGFDNQFGGKVNGYGRAMGEGNADWFAYLGTKNPKTGLVAYAWTAAGYLRDLDNTRRYPGDVDHPESGVPEEHYTGEIWGGYLYDLSQVLKGKALQYVYEGLYYFDPAGGFRSDYPDFYDAMWAQVMAEYDATGKINNSIKTWGTAASRGISGGFMTPPYSHDSDYFGTGAAGSDNSWAIVYSGSKLATSGRFLSPATCNEYLTGISDEGQDLDIKLIGKNTSPSITLYNSSETEVAASTDNTSKKATLKVADITPDLYSIVVCGEAAGKYKFQVKVK